MQDEYSTQAYSPTIIYQNFLRFFFCERRDGAGVGGSKMWDEKLRFLFRNEYS